MNEIKYNLYFYDLSYLVRNIKVIFSQTFKKVKTSIQMRCVKGMKWKFYETCKTCEINTRINKIIFLIESTNTNNNLFLDKRNYLF